MSSIKNYEYYRQLDCPMPILENIQNSITDKMDAIFNPDSKENLLLLNNDIMFVDNGIILFGRINLLLIDSKIYIKLLTAIDEQWLDVLCTIKENIQVIKEILTPYIVNLQKYKNTNSIPYVYFDRVCEKIENLKPNEEDSFIIPVSENIPKIMEMYKDLACYLHIKRSSKMNILVYEIVLQLSKNSEKEVISSGKVEITNIRMFLNSILYNGEILNSLKSSE